MDLDNQTQLEAEDRITILPDPLLHHILSFLEIKDVARTCVLSKTWEEIWKSFPTLDFLSLYQGLDTKKLMDIVDRVLFLRNMSSITKLRVRCSDNDTSYHGVNYLDAPHVDLWISAAVMRKVEEVSLDLIGVTKTFCPKSLFTCKSLITLELNVNAFGDFCLPKDISLPRLKYLKLGGYKFSSELKNNEKLDFFNCPVLADFTLEHCGWNDVRNFCILAPSVERLKIQEEVGNYSNYSLGLRHSGLEIDAPRLVSLTYKNSIPKDYVLSSSPALVEADVDDVLFGVNYRYHGTGEQKIGLGTAAIKFLRELSHVKVLSVAGEILEALFYAVDLIKLLPAAFNNLKQLNISGDATVGKALVALVRSAPNLESLIINERIGSVYLMDDEDDCNNGDGGLGFEIMICGCCFFHVKSFSIERFPENSCENWCVKLIFEKVKALRTMNISYSIPLYYENENVKSEEEVMAQLSSLLRDSTTSCVLCNILEIE